MSVSDGDLQYELSNRQVKRLILGNEEVIIALPVIPRCTDDLIQYAKSVLPQSVKPFIRSAEVGTVATSITRGANPVNLSEMLGEIVPADSEFIAILNQAVIVTLAAEGATVTGGAVQWPKSMISGKSRWPKDSR